jgi:DNA polymerase II large subunit
VGGREMSPAASNQYEIYLHQLESELKNLYTLAQKARSKGHDPSFEPETHIANDLAEMVEGLVGPSNVAHRIRELSKKMNKYEMAFVIAEDIVHAKFGHTDIEQASEQAIKTALAVMTGGITAAPIQGIAQTKIKQNANRSQYLAVYFAGPIRSAGGTEQALILVIGDHIRHRLGLEKYHPTEDEIHRFIEEIRLYEREVSRFQYHISDEELENALRRLPVEVNGMGTNAVEVSSYRNLPRIETNRVRGGALRVVNDGVVGRSQKVLKIVEDIGIEGWAWLEQIRKDQNQNQNSTHMYMEDVIAGRPIFSFPNRSGGFRLRYGRSRNMGLAALGIHPATMIILDKFLATGTQMRIDKPGKGGITVPVDTIEAPIVRLKDGSVIRVHNSVQAEQIKPNIEQILFLGDLLVGFGEFLENNKPLEPSGYTEEWWIQDCQSIIQQKFNDSFEEMTERSQIPMRRLKDLFNNPLVIKPTALETIALSQNCHFPLHPQYTYFWRNISFEALSMLRRSLIKSNKIVENGDLIEIHVPQTKSTKTILEELGIPHIIKQQNIILQNHAPILAICLKINDEKARLRRQEQITQSITNLSGILVKDKAMAFIGARMGRPEKAKPRKMSPQVHVLFPTSIAGGPRRNIVKAAEKSFIESEITRRKCPRCDITVYQLLCPQCGQATVTERTCPRCHKISDREICPSCRVPAQSYNKRQIKIRDSYRAACKKLRIRPKLVKGVRSLMSATKFPEIIEKGILRAKYDISIFKDGTIRFDATNAPLTHFTAAEIGVSISKLKQLGYFHDIRGLPLSEPRQVCELKVHDVIIPQKCAPYLRHATQFIDELLQKVYGLSPHYNVKRDEKLIGHLIIGLAPHTSAGVIGRILGFSETNVCYAHPLWHNIKRRDCDGDEDAILLVLDVLINFSKSYLPEQIGGMMDVPLLLISAIDPFEVDEAHNIDVAKSYPLVFYNETLKKCDPKTISQVIDVVAHRLGTPAQFEGYSCTHQTYDINLGNTTSSYTTLGAMVNKLDAQLHLARQIMAVDAAVVAKKVLSTHFMRDIAGNLKAFTSQRMRCKKCNAKYRRIPLSGRCLKCNSELLLTVHRKGIEKYLSTAQNLVSEYRLDNYYKQRLELIRNEINQIFADEVEELTQVKLGDFIG